MSEVRVTEAVADSPAGVHPRSAAATIRADVFLMDLLATVPYYTAYLARALMAAGVPVIVGSITYYLDRDCFRARGVPLQPGVMNRVGDLDLTPAPRRVLKLAELAINLVALTLRFASKPPAIVHVQFLPLLRWPLPLDLWFVRFCRWRGARIVLTVHDLLPHDTAERYRSVFQRLYRRADALICHSQHVRERLQDEFGISEDRIAVIAHGPFFFDQPESAIDDARRRLGIAAGRRIVLWQGILFPYKGLDLLLDAWQQVEEQNASAHLVVVGTGSPELLAGVRDQVARLGLARVTLDLRFASTEELVGAYRAAEVVVYPYRAITTSGALATGLALGKAIVASNLPVFCELLTDGQNAQLVTPGEAPALASAIVQLLADEAMRQRLIANVTAMNFAQRSWHEIAQQTIDAYTAVLHNKPQSAR